MHERMHLSGDKRILTAKHSFRGPVSSVPPAFNCPRLPSNVFLSASIARQPLLPVLCKSTHRPLALKRIPRGRGVLRVVPIAHPIGSLQVLIVDDFGYNETGDSDYKQSAARRQERTVGEIAACFAGSAVWTLWMSLSRVVCGLGRGGCATCPEAQAVRTGSVTGAQGP